MFHKVYWLAAPSLGKFRKVMFGKGRHIYQCIKSDGCSTVCRPVL